ncbi:MAG: hypothetical protein ACOX60_03150 [Massiliimalia sp.]|jgi:hypothetical protein
MKQFLLSFWDKHKILSVLLAVILAGFVLFAVWYFQPISTRTVTGQINGRKFSMEVPKDWKMVTDNETFKRYAPEGKAYTEDFVSINLSQMSEELGYSEESQSLLKNMIHTGDPDLFEKTQQSFFPDFRLYYHKKMESNGISMVKLSYALCKDPEWEYSYKIGCFFEEQDDVYFLYLSWEHRLFKPMSRILQKTAASFQWES